MSDEIIDRLCDEKEEMEDLVEAAIVFRSGQSSLPEFCEAVDEYMIASGRAWPEGPKRARLDADGTAQPLTEIAAVFPDNGQVLGFPHQVIEYKVRATGEKK